MIIVSAYLYGQENKIDYSEDWKNKELSNKDIVTNITKKISYYDLSTIWKTKNDFPRNGSIGSNYQRIQLYIHNVTKDIDDLLKYRCAGKSMVINNICDFTGTITIRSINQYKNVRNIDDTLKNAIGGSIIAEYEFFENNSQKHTGVFKGIVVSYWYLDTLKNIIHYNELEIFSDSYENNTFVGTWTSYTSNKQRLCIWGDYRIPYTKGLYIGAGDILIDDKYKEHGWQEFSTMWLERENSKNKRNKWWK